MSGTVGPQPRQEMKTKFSPRDINARQLSTEARGALSRVLLLTRGIGSITRNVRRRSKSRVLSRARLIEIRATINICIRFMAGEIRRRIILGKLREQPSI